MTAPDAASLSVAYGIVSRVPRPDRGRGWNTTDALTACRLGSDLLACPLGTWVRRLALPSSVGVLLDCGGKTPTFAADHGSIRVRPFGNLHTTPAFNSSTPLPPWLHHAKAHRGARLRRHGRGRRAPRGLRGGQLHRFLTRSERSLESGMHEKRDLVELWPRRYIAFCWPKRAPTARRSQRVPTDIVTYSLYS